MKLKASNFEDFLSFGNAQFPENIQDKGDCWDFELDVISIYPNPYTDNLSFSSCGTCKSQWSDHDNTYIPLDGEGINMNLSPEDFLKLESYYDEMIEWAEYEGHEVTDVEFIVKPLRNKKQLIIRFTVETETTIDTWDYKL